ncbi:c-type cytochrome [Granulicella cerasi]|uniref:C-type cytochrome n=1 Tax=Granulicella cerasi TaxID=741063 RepID=A0ABW1Z8M4_9BACT|nr:cytochrome c [Granulicella cerasi]
MISARIFSAALGATLLFATTGCKSTPPPKPIEQLTTEEAHGYAVFQAHCAQCHRDRTDGKLVGPPLLGVTKKQYLPSGAPANDERMSATILHGRGMMPAQPLDDQELADVLKYLHTL